MRDAAMAERLFGEVYGYWGDRSPRFVSGKAGKGFARRFQGTIHRVDSRTIELIASCMDWAKHRRRKASASVVLTTPGLSVIIDAIKESRRILQRMNSYAIYRIAETLGVLILMTLSILIFNFYPLTAYGVLDSTKAKTASDVTPQVCKAHGAATEIVQGAVGLHTSVVTKSGVKVS